MKYLLILIILFSNSVAMVAQSRLDSLLDNALNLADSGHYIDAIMAYRECLKIEPDSPGVHLELVSLYREIGNKSKAIEHCDSIIANGTDFVCKAYVLKGTILNDMGKYDESQIVSEQALKKFNDSYQLNYNLGVSLYNSARYQYAEIAIQKAIKLNPTHASSHLLLGYINLSSGFLAKALFSLYYYLLLEPNTERSSDIIKLILSNDNVKVKLKSYNLSTVYFLSPVKSGLYYSIDSDLPFDLSREKKKEHKTEYNLYFNITKIILNRMEIFHTIRYDEYPNNFYIKTYSKFFYDLLRDNHLEIFINYSSQKKYPESQKWLAENEERLNKFGEWLKQRED